MLGFGGQGGQMSGQRSKQSGELSSMGPGGPSGQSAANRTARRQLYAPVLKLVRELMVCRMCKPEEVLIVEDENGDIIREYTKDTDAITLYKTQRETLVFLTHLDVQDMEQLMVSKLGRQMDGSEWSFKNINQLCWAVGSISGAMEVNYEKQFLITVIKSLLSLCDMKVGKANKAVVASNVMYTVGQYPRFLQSHWKFMKTVVYKLFEFMHEPHPGVQVRTLLLCSVSCVSCH